MLIDLFRALADAPRRCRFSCASSGATRAMFPTIWWRVSLNWANAAVDPLLGLLDELDPEKTPAMCRSCWRRCAFRDASRLAKL